MSLVPPDQQETADAPDGDRGGTLDATPRSERAGRWESGFRLAGRYEIQEELGRGGMGAVYRARDMSLDREVAIKVLLVASDPRKTQRFEREARALSKLRHPNIVSVHDVGVHAGRPFLVMDLLPGESLEARLKRGPLPISEAAEHVRVLAWAVAHAHDAGILHRDLKPENVLLGDDAVPRLVDFGLAKVHDEATRLTLSGAALGTPAFWPPEQARGQRDRVGPRSDVYGLGGILYAALSARAPFEGLSLMELINATIDTQPEPPSGWNREVPAELDAICLKCLAKDQGDRFDSAEALALALASFLQTPARSAGRGQARIAAWSCVALALLGGLAALGWARRSGQALAAAERQASVLGPEQRLQRALFRFLLDRGEEALAELDALPPDWPNLAHALELRGDVHAVLLAHRELAVSAYSRSLALRPDNATALSSRGVTLQRLGRTQEALADLDRAVNLRGSARNHLNRGAARLESGDAAGALADFDRCVELAPRDPDGYAGRAWVFRDRGDLARSQREAEVALSLDPNHIDGLYNRSTVFYRRGEFAKAKADLDRILRLDPDSADALYAMGAIHEKLGELSVALDYVTRAVARDPDDPNKLMSRGFLRERTGDLLGAREDLESVLPLLAPAARGPAEKALARINRQPDR